MNMVNEQILEDIRNERARQEGKWGVQNHSLVVWLAILAEEFGEASMAINEFHFRQGYLEDVRTELIQTAAVAVAMIDYIDRHSVKSLVENEHSY